MRNFNLKFKIIIASLILSILAIQQVYAVCPVCTIAVMGGVGLFEWLGIDDVITGIWLGGLAVSLSLWTIDWLDKKNIKFLFRKISVFIAYYLMILLPLQAQGLIKNCKLWGFNKLMLGVFFGTLGFSAGVWADKYMRAKNSDKVYFYFQKVIMPVGALVILSIIFYIITQC